MSEIFFARIERVGGSAIPATIANASQTGVKGIASGALKISYTKKAAARLLLVCIEGVLL